MLVVSEHLSDQLAYKLTINTSATSPDVLRVAIVVGFHLVDVDNPWQPLLLGVFFESIDQSLSYKYNPSPNLAAALCSTQHLQQLHHGIFIVVYIFYNIIYQILTTQQSLVGVGSTVPTDNLKQPNVPVHPPYITSNAPQINFRRSGATGLLYCWAC